jgi:DNA-binding Lrp family transcriptional regulator
VDDTDRQILTVLREDASQTNAAVGRRVGLTEAAVRRRVARMQADGTIVRFTVVTVPLGPEGLVLIRCRPGRTAEILRHVQARASEVFESSGEFDLGAFVERPTMEAFNRELDELRALDGVVSTVTLVRLTRSVRPRSGPSVRLPAAPAAPRPAARPDRPR